MRRRNGIVLSILVFLLLVFLLAWGPWLDAKRAAAWASSDFTEQWKNTSDGCGVVRAIALGKVLFGYKVELVYECGLQPLDAKPPEESITRFVTTIGLVLG